MALKPTNTLLDISIPGRSLELLKRPLLDNQFKRVKVYRIAVGYYDGPGGEPDYRTPVGYYQVEKRAKNPTWTLPSSPWVEEEDWGKVIPGGDPRNPIVARWIQLTNTGVGIHGTAARDSIGTAASHGCIRMLEEDVIELFDQVPKGTIVHIS